MFHHRHLHSTFRSSPADADHPHLTFRTPSPPVNGPWSPLNGNRTKWLPASPKLRHQGAWVIAFGKYCVQMNYPRKILKPLGGVPMANLRIYICLIDFEGSCNFVQKKDQGRQWNPFPVTPTIFVVFVFFYSSKRQMKRLWFIFHLPQYSIYFPL